MSVEKVDGLNKLPSKEIVRVEPQKAAPGSPQKPGSNIVESSKKIDPSSFNPMDIVEVKGKEAQEEDLVAAVKEGERQDSVELSARDPELIERIRELIESIKEQKAELARRIKEAQMLIMQRAYDNNDEVRKTAESIIQGEQIDRIDT